MVVVIQLFSLFCLIKSTILFFNVSNAELLETGAIFVLSVANAATIVIKVA